MPNNKHNDRRSIEVSAQDDKDLSSAITELHQTVVRLNRVIERVHPRTKAEASKSFGKPIERNALDLASLKIPKTIH